MKKTKESKIIIAIIALILLLVLTSVFVFIFKPRSSDSLQGFSFSYPNFSKVGYQAEYLGTTKRSLPELSNEGLARYPVYGQTLSGATKEEKQAITSENQLLNASSSSYDSMDEQGNLYLNGVATGQHLYKHTASVGMYEGNVSDSEEAVIKRMTIKSRSRGNHITGLYAPAGEVVKIEISEDDLAKTGGVKIHIGQILTNGQANNIWLERDFNRMPYIVNTMTINSSTAYVGSYLGGPIYVEPINKNTTFTITISGAVKYSHFILGYTSEEEFEFNQSSAPYFDLEVWYDGVRHSGPNSRVKQFDYYDLYKAAVLWDKIALVSNNVPSGSPGDVGITFLYDPFIAAGSMVAFVGRYTVNCPLNCLTAALDYESAVTNASDPFWGCIHEFNHHYQKFGFSPGDEVTNNAVSLVSYSLFTKISSRRSLANANQGNYATSWNRYTNPSWVLKQTLNTSSKNSNLDTYANILHTFGQELFIKATQYGNGSGGADTWYKSLCETMQYDMTYYFESLLHQTISDNVKQEVQSKGYPIYVPVATIYQTGRSFLYQGQKQFSKTVQPYQIPANENFLIDLKNNIILPSGFSYKIKNITSPKNGRIVDNTDGTYTYIPSETQKASGEIIVTLSITKDDKAFNVEDVDLVLEFEQAVDSSMLERTVYTYTNDTMYSSLDEAYKNNYAGYQTVKYEDNINNVQNGNAEIWDPKPTNNAIMEIKGKILIKDTGKYRIALRARRYANLYISTDGTTFNCVAKVNNQTNSPDFDLTNPEHYHDLSLEEGQWLYFKATLMVTYERSFIGVGWGKFNGDNVSVSYLNAYRNSYEYEEFTSEYFYTHNFAYTYHDTPDKAQTLVETNYQPWDENYPISNLFDDNKTNFIHSNRTPINSNNPFELTVDLGETITANTFTIYGEPSKKYLPKTFKLYAGTTLDNLELINEQENLSITGNNVVLNIALTSLRYYKLVVTDTTASATKYIAYRYAEFSYNIENGTQLSPDDKRIEYFGNWKIENHLSTFGHNYVGENIEVKFNFNGSQFAIMSFAGEKISSFDVYIDGKKIDTISNIANENSNKIVYLSDVLNDGEHEIKIKTKGSFNLDSIIIW